MIVAYVGGPFMWGIYLLGDVLRRRDEVNDHLSERELVRMAVATLHQLARACHATFRAKRTRQMILNIEHGHHQALLAYSESKTLVSDSARVAWLELDQDCRDLIAQRGQNPDSMLEWLDLYPRTLLTVILSPKTAQSASQKPRLFTESPNNP